MTSSLDSLGVQEMNAQEVREVEGGAISVLIIYGGFLLAGIAVGYWLS